MNACRKALPLLSGAQQVRHEERGNEDRMLVLLGDVSEFVGNQPSVQPSFADDNGAANSESCRISAQHAGCRRGKCSIIRWGSSGVWLPVSGVMRTGPVAAGPGSRA